MMPVNKEKELEAVEEYDVDFETFDDSDYGFIIGPEGELKSIMFPEGLMEDPPVEIKRILKIFGIKNIYDIEPKTIH